ncbi:MAG: hypothetical protein E7619_09800 [Ruminococcaceae bacterium]|nr:hypothetical protein [Oscillospiraceae bacterium]
MKRLFSRIIALVFVTASVFAFSSCKHEHVYGEWSYAMLPTCTEEGVQSRMCLECEETEKRPAAPLGHDEISYERKDATCTEKGHRAYVACSRCDYTTYEEILPRGHSRISHAQKAPTCTEDGNDAYITCSECDFTTYVPIPKLGHDIVQYGGKEADCVKSGYESYEKCNRCDYSTYKVIPARGHVIENLAEKAPTCTESGLAEGSHCSVCNKVFKEQKVLEPLGHNCKKGFCTVCGVEDYLEPTQYASSIMYNTLASYPNGKDMQTLYRRIGEVAKSFHLNYDLNLELKEGKWALLTERIKCSDLSLSKDDGYVVGNAFYKDNPIYYWLYTFNWNTDSSGKITYFFTYAYNGYEKGSDRERINKQIASEVKEYVQCANGETSAYQTALCYYELVIKNTTYEYAAIDVDPTNFRFCRNILGTLIYGRAVCVGYARAFNLLLNLNGIESCDISGADHTWSLVRMDDGKYYWFDPTWDDQPNMPFGYETKYFCVNDTQPINWRDRTAPGGTSTMGNKGFLSEHPPYKVGEENIRLTNWTYSIPERPSVEFASSDVLELRETFTVDGKTYALVGYRRVQLVKTEAMEFVLDVPEKVSYNGVDYIVVSVGGMMNSGLFDGARAIGSGYAKSVILPNTVEYVMPRAITSESSSVNIFYEGTLAEWREVTFATKYLARSKVYYYSETRPTTSGNYWHYVNGTATPW